jgi:short-subunit dehydrogenase
VRTEFFDHAFATNGSEVQNYIVIYEAKDVVATGLHDLYKTKKQVSVHGFVAKGQRLLVKLLPHSLVMKVWVNQQKKPKNDPRGKNS